MWIKKTAIVMGVVLGLSSATGAMLLTSRNASATVLVKDTQNIEEAIKTAISTASILTNVQKQVLMQIIDMKKLSGEDLLKIMDGSTQQKKEIWDEHEGRIGILMGKSTPGTILSEQIGNVEDILNGDIAQIDPNVATQKGLPVLEKTTKDAAASAKNTAVANEEISKQVEDALKASNAAEGNLQAIQAGNALQAADVQATLRGNEILANMAAMNAANYQQTNVEKAMAIAIDRATKKALSDYVGD